VGCYIWYSEEGPGRAAALPGPLIAVIAIIITSCAARWPPQYEHLYSPRMVEEIKEKKWNIKQTNSDMA